MSLELLELDGALLDPELELGVLAEPLPEPLLLEELELGLEDEPELGVEAEPDIEDDEDGLDGEVLEPDEDDDGLDGELLELEPDDDGLAGDVLEDEDPAEDLSPERDAPGAPVLSQPYRPPTATAMGITTKAVFLSKLIEGSSQ